MAATVLPPFPEERTHSKEVYDPFSNDYGCEDKENRSPELRRNSLDNECAFTLKIRNMTSEQEPKEAKKILNGIVKSYSEGSVKNSQKKRVRWPDIEGCKATCYEFQPDPESSSEEEEDDEDKEDDFNKKLEIKDHIEQDVMDIDINKKNEEGESTSEESALQLNKEPEIENQKDGANSSSDDDDTSSSDDSTSSESEEEEEDKNETHENIKEVKVVDPSHEDANSSSSEEEDEVQEEMEESEDESDEDSEEESSSLKGSKLEGEVKYEISQGDDSGQAVENVPVNKTDTNQLLSQISELERNLLSKTSGMERLQNELESVYNESEQSKKRFRRLQDELDACRRCNTDLIERLNQQSETESTRLQVSNEAHIKEAEERIKDLDKKLSLAKEENEKLRASLQKLEKEREVEMHMVQQALDEALHTQEEMEQKFNKEFEQLRTLNANRELKLIDDFEWKLREVQKQCKAQIQEKERLSERKIVELQANLCAANEAVAEKTSQFQVLELELKQIKTTGQEQKRSLRTLTRKYEELQVNEKILHEEINRLRGVVEKEKNNFQAIQTLHKEGLQEKERKLQFKLETQKTHLNTEWEERLKRECSKIKTDLERTFREEKRIAVETAKNIKEQENRHNRNNWEKKIQEYIKEVGGMKKKISEKEEQHKRDLENAQSKSDSDVLELRRKMDKLDMSYQEKIEKIQDSHEQDIAMIKEEWQKRVQQCEASLLMQAGTTRTTLELVKQQMQKEAETKLQQQKELHHKALEEQWHRLVAEKDAAVEALQEKHRKIEDQLRHELAILSKGSGSKAEVISCKEIQKVAFIKDLEFHQNEEQSQSRPLGQNKLNRIGTQGETGKTKDDEVWTPEENRQQETQTLDSDETKKLEPVEKFSTPQLEKKHQPPSRQHRHRRSKKRRSGKH